MIQRLAVGGNLADMNQGMHLIFSDPAVARKKAEYWSRKGNIGIVPKLLRKLVSKENNSTGIVMSDHALPEYGEEGTFETLKTIWHDILMAKFNQNAPERDVLLGTGEKLLLEFDRSAKANTLWGGKIVIVNAESTPAEYTVVGRNFMGQALTRVRDALRSAAV